MNTQSNAQSDAASEPSFHSQVIAPAVISPLQHLYWSVRRELWEYRSIYVAPLAVAGVVLFGFLFATLGRALSTSNLALRAAILAEPKTFAEAVVMGTAFLV